MIGKILITIFIIPFALYAIGMFIVIIQAFYHLFKGDNNAN